MKASSCFLFQCSEAVNKNDQGTQLCDFSSFLDKFCYYISSITLDITAVLYAEKISFQEIPLNSIDPSLHLEESLALLQLQHQTLNE